jgi:hypothetical protein
MNLQGSNTYNKVKNKNLQNTTQYTVRTVTKYNTGHCQNSYKIQHRTESEQLQNTTQDTVRTVTKSNRKIVE